MPRTDAALPPGTPEGPAGELLRLARIFAASALGAFAVSALAASLAPGDAAPAADLFVPGARHMLAPEPAERFAYAALCLLLPALVLAAAWLDRRIGPLRAGTVRPAVPVLSVLAAAIAPALLLSDLGFHLCSPPFGRPYLAAALAALPCTWLVWGRGQRPATAAGRALWYAAAGACLLAAASFRVFGAGSVTAAPAFTDHFNAVLYSASQVMAGAKLLTDLPAQYGLYALYLKPLFAAAGFSVLAFTAAMTALLLLCLAGLARLLGGLIESFSLRALCFAGLTYLLGCWSFLLVDWDPYYQYTPVRLLFPVAVTLLADLHLRRPGRATLLAASFAAGFGLLWNLDSGLVACGAWLALLLLRDLRLLRGGGLRAFAAGPATGLAGAAAGALASYLLLSLANGEFLRLGGLFAYQSAYYLGGLNMLPLPLRPHPWLLVAAVYLAALVYALRGALRDPLSRGRQTALFLAVLGCGLFSYYQGRSHDFNLPAASWPAWLLACLAAGRAGRLVAAGRLPRAVLLPLGGFLFVALCWSLNMAAGTGRFYRAAAAALAAAKGRPAGFTLAAAALEERAALDGSREVLVLSYLQAAYYSETGLRSPFRGPSLSEMPLAADAARLAAAVPAAAAEGRLAADMTFGPREAAALWGSGAGQVLGGLRACGRVPGSPGLTFLCSSAAAPR